MKDQLYISIKIIINLYILYICIFQGGTGNSSNGRSTCFIYGGPGLHALHSIDSQSSVRSNSQALMAVILLKYFKKQYTKRCRRLNCKVSHKDLENHQLSLGVNKEFISRAHNSTSHKALLFIKTTHQRERPRCLL